MPNLANMLEAAVEPIGLLWLLNIIAAIRWTRSRQWRPALFCWFVAGVITTIGSTSLPGRLLASLERPYAARQLQDIPDADVVVMLGGVLAWSEHDLLGFQFGDAGDRALTAAELFRRGKARTLVLGGGGGRRKFPPDAKWQESPLLENWLKTWGIAATNFVPLALSRNTREEALQVRDLAKERHWQRIILVTSAYHMKRAEAIFRQLGVPTIPVACDFVGLSGLSLGGRFDPVPDSGGFGLMEVYLHEKIGWYYYRLRGWVSEKDGV